MDESEKKVIKQSMHYLCRQTTGQVELSMALTSAGVLEREEATEIASIIYDQNKKIFGRLLETEEKIGWDILLEIFQKSGNPTLAKFLEQAVEELRWSIKKNPTSSSDPSADTKMEALTISFVDNYRKEMERFIEGNKEKLSTLDLTAIGQVHQRIKFESEKMLEEGLRSENKKVRFQGEIALPKGSGAEAKYYLKFNDMVNLTFGKLMEDLSGGLTSGNNSDSKFKSQKSTKKSNDWRHGKDYRDKKWHFSQNFGEDMDIILTVGREKKDIRTCKMRLIIASPVFEQQFKAGDFNSNRLNLPNYDPKLFTVFIDTLPPVPEYTMDELVKEFSSSLNDILMFMVVRKKYEVTEPENAAEICLGPYFGKFPAFMRKKEFLELTQDRLEQIVVSDFVPMEELTIFENVCRWAESRCEKNGIEVIGKNLRANLGPVLSQIRFPLLSFQSFFKMVAPKNILTQAEVLQMTEFLNLPDSEKKSFDFTNFPFPSNPRSMQYLVQADKIILANPKIDDDEPPFHCDGRPCHLFLNMESQVELHAVAFFGPIHEDCYLQISVSIETFLGGKWISHPGLPGGKQMETMFAKQKEIFYFEFDQPILIGLYSPQTYNNQCKLTVSLKGPDIMNGDQNKLHTWRKYGAAGAIIIETYVENLQVAALKVKKIANSLQQQPTQ